MFSEHPVEKFKPVGIFDVTKASSLSARYPMDYLVSLLRIFRSE